MLMDPNEIARLRARLAERPAGAFHFPEIYGNCTTFCKSRQTLACSANVCEILTNFHHIDEKNSKFH